MNNLNPIPEQIAQVGLIGIFGIIAIGLIGVTIMTIILFKHKDGEDIVDMLKIVLESNRALQLITVSAVIIAVMFLSLINQINNNGVIALLSGISGYVLGSLGGKGKLSSKGENKVDIKPAAPLKDG